MDNPSFNQYDNGNVNHLARLDPKLLTTANKTVNNVYDEPKPKPRTISENIANSNSDQYDHLDHSYPERKGKFTPPKQLPPAYKMLNLPDTAGDYESVV